MESRWTWRLLALPGVAWLTVFFLVALYAVVAVAFGNQNTLSEPVPYWNPLDWNVGYVLSVLENIWDGGQFLTVFVRTFVFVAIALALSLLIGYPVAYFTARHAGRWKALVLVLLILPFWINYLMRMLAWINLLSPDGLGTRALDGGRDRGAVHLARPALDPGRLARGSAVDRDPRARLRLRPVPDPAALRGARPDRPAADRGGARPRRQPVRRLSTGHAAALDAGRARRASC